MKDFGNWLRRYTKSKFFKFVLFFAIFCIVSLCKKCDAYASWRYLSTDGINGTGLSNLSYIQYNFSQLNYNENTGNLYHEKDISYKVGFFGNSPTIDNDNFLILKNIVIDYRLWSNFTFNTGNNKYLAFNINNFYKYDSSNGRTYFNFLDNPLTTQTGLIFNNLYNFYPYYGEYLDANDFTWKPLPVIRMWAPSADYSNFVNSVNIVIDLPADTVIREVRFYFGSEKNYYGSLTDINSNIRTENNTKENYYFSYYKFGTNSSTNYRQGTYRNSLGSLAYLPNVPGANINNLNNSPSINLNFSGYGNIVSRGDTADPVAGLVTNFIYPGDSLEEIKTSQNYGYENTLQTIVNENANANITGGTTDDYNADKAVKMNAGILNFQDNYISDNFHGLFSALFAYPLQKLNEIKDIDLRGNNGTSDYMNLGLCTGSNSITGDWNDRYQIRFARPGSVDGTWYFELPCPHYDIYPKIYHGNYRFMSGVSSTLDLSTFEGMWRTIMRGILVYWLYVTCLSVYKYVIDINDTKVEVLEL